MTQYKVRKINSMTWRTEEDYGLFTDVEQVKELVKGYKRNEKIYERLGHYVYDSDDKKHCIEIKIILNF